MASKGKKTPRELAIEALNKITRAKPHPTDLWNVIMGAENSLALEGKGIRDIGALTRVLLQREGAKAIPDATFALIASTALDQILELTISTHFPAGNEDAGRRIFDGNADGPIAGFAAKIKMAHVLGIYPTSAKDELDLIRHIRNAFAHSWDELDFTNQAIVDACAALELPQHFKRGGSVWNPKPIPWTPKSRFLHSVMTLYVYLEWNGAGQPVLYSSHPQGAVWKVLEDARKKPSKP